MKTKEAILDEIIRDWATPVTRQDAMQAMDEWAAQVLENQDPWISVKNSLPKICQLVVGLFASGEIDMITILGDNNWYFASDLRKSVLSYKTDVTHYMPIPSLPKTTE